MATGTQVIGFEDLDGIGKTRGGGSWRGRRPGNLPRYACNLLPLLALLMVLPFTTLLSLAEAAEFGEIRVRSYIGQPLNAEVELVALTPEESSALQVRAAGIDVYRGANIQYNPVLKSLHFVVQHRDRRQFIRLSSDKPVFANYLNLFFEMGAKGDHVVRALTLWLEPDPNYVAEPERAAPPLPESASSAARAPAHDAAELPVGKGRGAALAATPPDTAHGPDASHAPPHAPSHAPSHVPPHATAAPAPAGAANCAQVAGRCRAAEQVNQIIAARINELEKDILILNQEILRSPGKAGKPAKPVQTEAEPAIPEVLPPEAPMPEASTPNGLFLEKEPILLPKKVPPKPVWWRQYLWWLVGGGALLLLGGAWLAWRARSKKRIKAGKGAKADQASDDKPVDTLAAKSPGRSFKFDRALWQQWRARLFAPFVRLKQGMAARLQALRSRFGKKKAEAALEPSLEEEADAKA